MDEAAVAGVRRFSRLVTQRVGALDDHYLSRDRPLGQARVLWEIGADGAEVGVLRARLGLDPAQLSRTLRSLEQDGLVTVVASRQDSRVRVAALTRRGRAEWSALETGSEQAARSLLDPLPARQQERLVAAMSEVERLLMAAMVDVAARAPADPLARACLRAYRAEIEQRFGGQFVAGGGDEGLLPPDGLLLVATLQDEAVGCGALRHHPDGPPEIKRLWTAPSARGLGLGRRLLDLLERAARDAGATAVRLDTNRALTEATALYRSAGYREIPRYNDNPHADFWFEKPLA